MADFRGAISNTTQHILTTQEAFSGISGSISLAAWIFLLVPQLLENYRQQSAHGISLIFIFVWFIGDVTNLAGAIWARLVPTVIALAVYFCIADTVLIMQCLYYNYRNRRLDTKAAASISTNNEQQSARISDASGSFGESSLASEDEPLLSRRRSGSTVDNLGLPGSHRRKSSAASSRRRRPSSLRRRNSDALAKILEEDHESRAKQALKNIICVLLVCTAGAAGWTIAWRAGVWRPVDLPDNKENTGAVTPFGAELLGYISAVAYLGARIPQIFKNWREKSCDGLSLLFFMLSLLGNASYGAGILFHSLDKNYVLTNLPWLIGSLGTMVEDVMIFVQFHVYGDRSEEESVED